MPNTPEARVNVTVRLSPDELASIDKHAEALDRSRSEVIRQMLKFATFAAKPGYEKIAVWAPLSEQWPEPADETLEHASRAAIKTAAARGRMPVGQATYINTVPGSSLDHPYPELAEFNKVAVYEANSLPGQVFPSTWRGAVSK